MKLKMPKIRGSEEPFIERLTKEVKEYHRASHLDDLAVDLGWVDFDLGVPPSCLAVWPILQNWADSGTHKILVYTLNPVHDNMGHSVPCRQTFKPSMADLK